MASKCLQDGTLQDYTRVVNSGVVGGNSDINPIDILRLISELEGSSALMKYMEFNEDREIINTMKRNTINYISNLTRINKNKNGRHF